MFKIGDFSRLAQVSTRMLRHYDHIGLLKPDYTDEWTGYRYYTVEQLPRIHRIVALKELGFSLEEVTRLMNQPELPIEQMRGMLRLRQVELERELEENQRRLREVEARLHQIEQEGRPPEYEVVVKPLEAHPVASLRQIVPHVSEMGFYCEMLYGRLYDSLRIARVKPAGPEITLYHADEYRETDLEVETAVVVDPQHLAAPPASDVIGFHQLPPVELAASLFYEGAFEGLESAILDLLRWVALHDHTLAGPMRELHLSGPAHPCGELADSAIIELQVPIARLSA